MVDLAVAVFERHPRHRVCVLTRDHRVTILAADLHAQRHTRAGSVSEGHRQRIEEDPRPCRHAWLGYISRHLLILVADGRCEHAHDVRRIEHLA